MKNIDEIILIENNTWMCRNMKFTSSVDHAGYVTSEQSEQVRYPVQHEK